MFYEASVQLGLEGILVERIAGYAEDSELNGSRASFHNLGFEGGELL